MSKRTKKQLLQSPKYVPVEVPEENFEDLDNEDYWHNYDGECQGCNIYGPVNDKHICVPGIYISDVRRFAAS